MCRVMSGMREGWIPSLEEEPPESAASGWPGDGRAQSDPWTPGEPGGRPSCQSAVRNVSCWWHFGDFQVFWSSRVFGLYLKPC